MRKLAITQNITVDGSVEMLGNWFDPQDQAEVDKSDLLEELHRLNGEADALLVGRQTFEDFRGYWPKQSDDATGITDYLNQVQNTLSPRRCRIRSGRTLRSCPVVPWSRFVR